MKHFFEFGSFRLDKSERQLLRNGSVVSLTPKAFDTLLFLVENHGHVLEKNELMKALWPGSFVEEGNLTDNISKLRQALGDDRKSPQYIETVPRRGYRFMAEVQEIRDEERIGTRGTATISQGENQTERHHPVSLGSLTKRWPSAVIIAICATLVGLLLISNRAQPDPTLGPIRIIAVLPPKPLVEDQRDEMLELAMADGLIRKLGRLSKLTVRPLDAVRKYAKLEQNPVMAGREQRVDAVLVSTIQRLGERIRVAGQLVSVADGRQIWQDQFDTEFTDILKIQDSISEKIARALEIQLTRQEQKLLTKHYTDNREAERLYQLGHYFWNRATTKEDLEKAIEKFNLAREKDPQYALPYVGLADSYGALAVYGYKPMTVAYPLAMKAAEQALKIDDTLGEAHTSMAVVYADYYRDWVRAEQHYLRAIDLSPNHAPARYFYAGFLAGMGRFDEAIPQAKQGQNIDPLSPNSNVGVAYSLNLARRYDEAIEETRKALDLDSGFGLAQGFLVESYLGKGMYNEAISILQKLEDYPAKTSSLGYAYAMSGRTEEAGRMLKELDQLSKRQPVPAIYQAKIYIGLREKDRAFKSLDQALEEHAWELGTIKVNFIFDPLRSDSRFTDLMRRVGLSQ